MGVSVEDDPHTKHTIRLTHQLTHRSRARTQQWCMGTRCPKHVEEDATRGAGPEIAQTNVARVFRVDHVDPAYIVREKRNKKTSPAQGLLP